MAVKPLRVDGAENSIRIGLGEAKGERSVRLHSSGWNDGTLYAERDAAGEKRESTGVVVADQLPAGEWTTVSLTVGSDELELAVGEATHNVNPSWDVAGDAHRFILAGNAWGNGDAVDVAFDDVLIEPV